MTWEEIWQGVINFCQTSGITLVRTILAFIIGLIIIKLVLVILKHSFIRANMEKITQSFLLSVVKFVLLVLLVIMALKMLGVDTTGLIAMVAAAGVAIGLALKDSLGNLASGIIIITTKPFKESDYVNVNGVEGKIKSIKMLSTKLLTYDNKIIILPNSAIISNPLTNYSARKLRRVDFTFSVDYATDPQLLEKVVLDVMHSNGHILMDPKPFISITGFGSSNVDYVTRCWVYTEDYWDVYYYIINTVFNEFKRNGINISYDQVEVRMRTDNVVMPYAKEPLPERTEIVKEKVVEIDDDLLLPMELDLKKAMKNKSKRLMAEKKALQKKLDNINKEIENEKIKKELKKTNKK